MTVKQATEQKTWYIKTIAEKRRKAERFHQMFNTGFAAIDFSGVLHNGVTYTFNYIINKPFLEDTFKELAQKLCEFHTNEIAQVTEELRKLYLLFPELKNDL